MKAIITLQNSRKFPRFPCGFLRVPPPRTYCINGEDVFVYSLSSRKKRELSATISRLRKKQTEMIGTKEILSLVPNFENPSFAQCVFSHFPAILSCFFGGQPLEPLVVCRGDDSRIFLLLEWLSRYTNAVFIDTADDFFFDRLATSLWQSHGLSLIQRQASCYRGKGPVIVCTECRMLFPRDLPLLPLWDSKNDTGGNPLVDFSSGQVEKDFRQFHTMNIKHCYFVGEGEKIKNLIWKF